MTSRALLFDLDGTLIDSIGLLLDCMDFAFAERSVRPTRAQWTATIGTPLRAQLAEWTESAQEIDALVQRYREFQDVHLESMTSLYAGVAETLTWARAAGHVTAIVTSKGKLMTARSLLCVGLQDAFDTIVTYEETDRHKPLPDPVWLALRRLARPASGAIFVGDSPHDMYSGNAAGVATAAAQWGPFSTDQLTPSNPTHWLPRMDALPALVKRLDTNG